MEAARIQGSRIRLISKSEIRYEGTLSTIDPQANTVSLKTVRMYGTEGRAAEPQIPASDALYDFIIFRGSDIKDLTVYESDKRKGEQPFVDPAVVQAQPSRKPSDGRHDRHQSHLPASNYGPSRHRSEFNGHSLESRGMYDDWAHGQDKRRSSHPHGGAPQHQAPHTYGGYGTRSFERPAYPHPSAADRGGDRHHGKGSGGKGGGGRFTQWEDNRHSNNNRRHSHNRSHHEEGRKGGKGGGGTAAGGASGGHWNPFATHTGTNFKVQDDADAETARKSAGIEADFNFEEAKIDMDKLKEEIPEEEKPQDGYDKKKSFFDMLSCETSDKNKEANKERVPKNQREVMRTADISTFGAEAVRAIESSFVRERGHRGGRTARHQPGGGGYSGGKGGYGKGRQGGYGKGGYGKGDGGGYLGYRGGRGGAARGRR